MPVGFLVVAGEMQAVTLPIVIARVSRFSRFVPQVPGNLLQSLKQSPGGPQMLVTRGETAIHDGSGILFRSCLPNYGIMVDARATEMRWG